MNDQPLIKTNNLSLFFDEKEIFSNISFSINFGEFTVIIGPNGAGKTQLMRVLLGLQKPSGGDLTTNFAVPEIGYVPQNLKIDKTIPITVNEFLRSYLKKCGFWLPKKLCNFGEFFGVEKLLNKKLGDLSGGEFQRVMLAVVLTKNPKILFLDEFAAGIDIGGQKTIFEYLADLNREQKTTIVMISHDLDVVAKYATQVLCLNKRMVCAGHPQEALKANVLEQMYGLPLTKLERHKNHQND